MAVSSRATARGGLLAWQVASAILLLVMAGIHVYLVVFEGWGGQLGTLFILNGIGGFVLAVAMLVTRGRLLGLASVLSLLFLAGTLLALILAQTVAANHDVLRDALIGTAIGLLIGVCVSAFSAKAIPSREPKHSSAVHQYPVV